MYCVPPFWTLLPPPSAPHPSGLSQCTGFECPASCIEVALVIYFTYGNIQVSMLFSQIVPLMYTWIFEKYPWGKSPCTIPTPLKVLTLTQRWEFATGHKNNIRNSNTVQVNRKIIYNSKWLHNSRCKYIYMHVLAKACWLLQILYYWNVPSSLPFLLWYRIYLWLTNLSPSYSIVFPWPGTILNCVPSVLFHTATHS